MRVTFTMGPVVRSKGLAIALARALGMRLSPCTGSVTISLICRADKELLSMYGTGRTFSVKKVMKVDKNSIIFDKG